MSEFVNEYKLQCYRKIRPLNEKEDLWLTEDSVTGKLFVMRKLALDLREVYERLADIHHPNLTEIAEVFHYKGSLYVVEEYLDWKLLSRVIETRSFSGKWVFSTGKQILSALSAVHGQRIVHRDVKPDNIMISEDGKVKLIDFDIARLFSEEKGKDTYAKGSRDYAPPEQFGFAQSDCRADLYAFGVTLNQMSTGDLPKVRRCTGRPGIIVRRCMQIDPARRYQSAGQALKHMEWLYKKIPLTVCVLFFCVILSAGLMLFGTWYQKGEGAQMSLKEAAVYTEYQDRIIAVRKPEAYPAVLLAEDISLDFTAESPVNEGDEGAAALCAEKEGSSLTLTLTGNMAEQGISGKNQDIAEFRFDDVFSDKYAKLGYSINTDFGSTSPEYELLLDDFNKDGKEDFLIALAWRRRIDTPEPENRYYLTEYSTLWLVCQDEKNQWVCSKPIYFEGCAPALQTDALLYDPGQPAWHTFQNGKWNSDY